MNLIAKSRYLFFVLGLVMPFNAEVEAEADTENKKTRPVGSLQSVAELARRNAINVIVARSELGTARASRIGAQLPPFTNPYLEVFANRGERAVTKDVSVQANLWLPIEISGQRAVRLRESDALVRWYEANRSTIEAMVVSEAVHTYGQVTVGASRVDVLSQIVESSKAESDVFEKRLQLGDTTVKDAKLALVELGRNSLALSIGRADLARALGALSQLTGQLFSAPPRAGPGPPPLKALSTTFEKIASTSPVARALVLESDYYRKSAQRSRREAHQPMNFIVTGGRGDLGEWRWGGGLSWSFPVLRTNQGEVAVARAKAQRASNEGAARIRSIAYRLRALHQERELIDQAYNELVTVAEPAADAAVDAALTMQRSGKADLLNVITARRDLALLKTRRMELLDRAWSITAEIVEITGEIP